MHARTRILPRVRAWWTVGLVVFAGWIIATRLPDLMHGWTRPEAVVVAWLLPAIVFQASVFLTLAQIWRRTAAGFTNLRVRTGVALRHVMILNVGKYLPGKVWGMAARTEQLVNAGGRVGDVLSATLAEQYVLLVSGALVALAAYAWTIGTTAGLLAIGLACLAGWLSFRLQRLGFTLIGRMMPALHNAGTRRMNGGEYGKVLAAAALTWILNGFVLYSLVNALYSGLLSIASLPLVISINTFAILAGFIAIFAPAGLGVREGVLAAGLSQVISADTAVIAALAYRIWLTVLDALFVLLLMLFGVRHARGWHKKQ